MWRDTWLVMGKDLKIELRSKILINQVVPFALLVLLLFGFALGPGNQLLITATPGLYWLAVLFAALLAVQRSFAIEAVDGFGDGFRLSGLDPAGIFLGKVTAVTIQLLVLEVILSLGVVIFYGSQLANNLWFVIIIAIVTPIGLSAVGIIYGLTVADLKINQTLFPMLLFGVAAPVLIAATKAFSAAIAGHIDQGVPWLDLLCIFDAVYLALGIGLFAPLLEDL
ncbi:MAG: heme exporter protein CcmB [Actinobacteria bacterium]|nr:heme exporter protein CcmB [Actinomycetota bacterium]MCL6104051.1 heme exporter protein CcmB [Actinomycetota bacterium]